jgi:biofilm PGA synthesis N-glycosyltransferase PgaC
MFDIPNLLTDKQCFIIFVVFCLACFVQLFYYLVIYLRFAIKKMSTLPATEDPVSVIICARNEAENLEKYLPFILTQQYPEFEVIVVDDCSTDCTEKVLEKLTEKYPQLRTTIIREDKKFPHGKKLAVTIGIKSAKYERLLFTDADCKPESDQWLKRMASHFSENISIVLGYGGYFTQPGLLNKYIRYDTLIIALQYFSYALIKMPYMGVGRNLAYKRSLFFKGKGFTNHFHLASGDDDLFVNEHATKTNTAIEFSHESHTRTVSKQSFERWHFQKKRHFSTSNLYKSSHKLMLTLEPLSRLFFYAAFISLMFSLSFKTLVLITFGLRLLIQLIIIKKTMIRLNEKNLLVISLLFDLISLIINVGLYISSRLRPANYQWK